MTRPHSVLILGAGLAGLTCASELAAAGVEVTVLEKLPTVGGLARNVERGAAKFDLGGHRFFSAKPELVDWLRTLVGDELRQVGRKSRIRLGGRYFDYPLRAGNALAGFGAAGSFAIVKDYAVAALSRALSNDEDVSFEGWVSSRFGRRLYEIYFRPYTEKVWGISCSQISADWAAQRIQLLSLADAVWQAVRPGGDKPKTYASQFWYPAGGIGVIGEILAGKIRDAGGKVHTGAAVEQITVRDGRIAEVVAAGETYAADAVISTIPLTRLGALINAPTAALNELSYRAIRCVFLVLNAGQITDDTWLYFPEPDVVFSRTHEPPNWAPELAPPQGTSLCLEVFCNEGDRLWSLDADDLADRCVTDLARLGLIKTSQVTEASDERVPSAYPVYRVGYKAPLRAVRERVAEVADLYLLGRTGAYRYDNMDQVVDAALALARRLTT